MRLEFLCAILLSFACVNTDDSTQNWFIYPTQAGPGNSFVADLTWPLGSTQNIQWSTTLDSYYIALFQQSYDPPSGNQLQTIYSIDSGGNGQQAFEWVVQTYNTNLTFSPVYFLWLDPGASSGFTSHYFNITNTTKGAQSSSSISSSTASASSTSLTSSTTASSIPTATSQESSQTSVTTPASASSNTEPLKVGLGVGLGVGIPLVLIAGVWIGLRLVRSRRSSSGSMNPGVPLSQYADMGYPPNSYPPPNQSNYYAHQLHEVPGASHEIHEVPAERALLELGSRGT